MANPEFFRSDFEALARNGYIGDPTGKPAYAYIRVSGSDQAEEGRSGLPRQIVHIHDVAFKHGYKIAWDLVYADDHTGFEFEGRPALTSLLEEVALPARRANIVVIEHLDRLSRNADWHQGYLLEKLKNLGLEAVFWKTFNSRVERAVLGAVAQEGMEHEKRRMMEGNLHKARSGRVTARVPAYGYKLVDGQGNEGLAARKDTYYAIRQDEAIIVHTIFRKVMGGDALRKIAIDLEKMGIKPPKKSRHWEAVQVRLILTNEIYKGDFYAHRWEHTKVQKPGKDGMSIRTVKIKRERPREEWIHVPVPAIVSADEWDAANRMLSQNARTARRNAKIPFLLTGLVKCAYCGWSCCGTTHYKGRKGKPRGKPYRGYRCPHYSTRPKYLVKNIECRNSYIPCEILDNAVWKAVCEALLEPHLLIEALDNDATSANNRQLIEQIKYLEDSVESKRNEDEKLYKAYIAGVFDEQEYAARRQLLREETAKLTEELTRLQGRVLTPEQLQARKTDLVAMSGRIVAMGIPVDPPFELKQRIIRQLVDLITLNAREKWFTIEGAIRGEFAIGVAPARAGTTATR